MAEYAFNTSEIKRMAPTLRAGDRVLLSGTVYTSRDAAHKRIKGQTGAAAIDYRLLYTELAVRTTSPLSASTIS